MKIRKNGKTINLSESDMKRIVKKLLSEQVDNTKNDFLTCCKDAGLDGSKFDGCVAMDVTKCTKQISDEIAKDPFGIGMKAANALVCITSKAGSPVKS